jgi:shikimate dehydrogenase
VREGRLVGHNTDAAGFLRALREAGFDPAGAPALVLGAGGAARAVVYALVGVGAHVTVLNRTLDRAEALARDLGRVAGAKLQAAPLDLATVRALGPQARLVVNATTVGMWRRCTQRVEYNDVDASPWPEAVPFPAGALAFDLVYNPRETEFMRQARAAGASAANGLGMLVHQGAEAFERWTGMAAPVEVMARACARALGGG